MAYLDPPLVSVILSVYNGDGYLREAIVSILNQTLDNFEFIIVNDGSADNTSQILKTFFDPRIVIIERENKGLSESLNEAIFVAKAKYIARMDADDIALANRLELQFNFMEAHSHVGILGGQAVTIDKQGRHTGEALKPISFDRVRQYIKYACPVMHPTYFVRKSVYDLTGGYRTLPIEDYDFLFRAFESGVIIDNLPEFLIKYRLIAEGLTLTNPQKTVVLTRVIQKMHTIRTTRGNESEKSLMLFAKKYNGTTGWWFRKVYETRAWAKKYLLSYRKKGNKAGIWLMSFTVISLSLLHYQLFINSYVTYKASKLV
jgi:glycosyltransferase involved in cell wall biosynthesis